MGEREKMKKSFSTILLAVLSIGILTQAFDAQFYVTDVALSGTIVYVDPSLCTFYMNTTPVGYHFIISLNVSNVVDLFAWQVKLCFNSTQIEAANAWLPVFDPTYAFYGRTTIMPEPFIDNVTGYVLIGDSIMIGPTFSGSGLLAKIEFEIMTAPPPNTTISCILDIDNAETFLLDSSMIEIPITRINGNYQYVYVARGPFPMLDDLYFVSAYPYSDAVSKALACQLDVVIDLDDVYASQLEENGWTIQDVNTTKSYHQVLLKFFKFPNMDKFTKEYVEGMVKKVNEIYKCACDLDVQFRLDGPVVEVPEELDRDKLRENLRKDRPDCTEGINVVFVPGNYPGTWNGITKFEACSGVKKHPIGGVIIRDTCNQAQMSVTLAHELMHALGLSHEIQDRNDPTLKVPPHGKNLGNDKWDLDGDGDADALDQEQLLWGRKDRTNTKITREQCEYMAKNAKETPGTNKDQSYEPTPPPRTPHVTQPPSYCPPPYWRFPRTGLPVHYFIRPEAKSNVVFDTVNDAYLGYVDMYGIIGVNHYDPNIGISALTLEVRDPIPNNTRVHYRFYLDTDDDNSTGTPEAPLPGADFYATLAVIGTSQSAELRKYVNGSWTYIQSLEWKIGVAAEDFIHEDYGGENTTGYLVTLYVPLDKLELADHGNMQVVAMVYDTNEFVFDFAPVMPISLEIETSPIAYSYPTFASPSETVYVYGIGFSPNTTVSVEFDWTQVATSTVDPSGCFVANFTIPSVATGVYQVNAFDSNGRSSTFLFSVNWIPVKTYYYAFKPGLRYLPETLSYGDNWMYGLLHWDNSTKTSANIHVPGPILTLNPGWATSNYEWQILNRLYDRLITTDPFTNKDIPCAAKSWKVDLWSNPAEGVKYGQKINFKLQNGILWHDGTLVNASTIKWNWDFIANIKMPAYYEIWKYYIRTEIVNQFEVNVYVNTTSPWTLYDLAGTALLFPPHIWNRYWNDPSGAKAFKPWETGELVGTGPWIFSAWNKTAEVVHVTANSFYWAHGRALAVTNVIPSKTVIGQGYKLNITATVANLGNYIETFNVSAYATSVSGVYFIEELQTTLNPAETTSLTFTLDTTGFAKGNYTIWAHAWLVPGETSIGDNTFVDGFVIVAMVGDITGPTGWPDGKVDVRDVSKVAKLFGVSYPNPKYDANCDIVYDRKIDVKDISTVAKRYGQTDP